MGNNFSCVNEGSMTSKLLPAVVIAAKSRHKATLIFLHGLGDTGYGWSEILQEHVPENFKIVCPHAPSIPVTLNNGLRMPSWYDIYGLHENAKQDEAGIKDASSELDKFVAAELDAGVPIGNIVIGGFSQGGSVALYNALTSDRHYGGVLALSCWLPLHTKFMSSPSMLSIPKDVHIFQCHGLDDCTIPFAMGKLTNDLLKMFQLCNCEFNSYPNLSHSSSEQELRDVRRFLEKIGAETQ